MQSVKEENKKDASIEQEKENVRTFVGKAGKKIIKGAGEKKKVEGGKKKLKQLPKSKKAQTGKEDIFAKVRWFYDVCAYFLKLCYCLKFSYLQPWSIHCNS